MDQVAARITGHMEVLIGAVGMKNAQNLRQMEPQTNMVIQIDPLNTSCNGSSVNFPINSPTSSSKSSSLVNQPDKPEQPVTLKPVLYTTTNHKVVLFHQGTIGLVSWTQSTNRP
jgi:hypothetical protein